MYVLVRQAKFCIKYLIHTFHHVYHLGTYLHEKTILLMDAAIQAVGVLGKAYSLPLPAEGDDELNKKAVVESLFSVLSNAKLNTKVCPLNAICRIVKIFYIWRTYFFRWKRRLRFP